MLTRLYRAVFTRAFMLSETLRQLTLCACVALISPLAMADGDLADMARAGADGAKSIQTSGITIIQVAGFFSVAGGLLSIKAMKNNPQIKPWMIVLAIVGGLLAIGIPEIIKRGMTQIGLTPVTIS
ncbi:TPA: conjugal transfer protein [Kluyvera ascorbata F0526]|nr:conjugal transfer protein [Kluyvera ascorbata F0526]